jgi:hypothetical protein
MCEKEEKRPNGAGLPAREGREGRAAVATVGAVVMQLSTGVALSLDLSIPLYLHEGFVKQSTGFLAPL